LQKFLGSLSIEEYRASLSSATSVVFMDKPISCTYPELIQYVTESGSTKPEYRLARKSKSIDGFHNS
jgi:hypothetical protein